MDLRKTHREAMKLMQLAQLSREAGGYELENEYLQKAFILEKEAAMTLFGLFEKEPTRGILFRSAASIALRLNNNSEAEKLIAAGLAGNPSQEMAFELRNLLEEVNSHRHLEIRGVKFEENDLQLSLSGGLSVGYGYIETREVLKRINAIGNLFYRRVEQKSNKKFRSSGGIPNQMIKKYPQYISTPRSQSFAVSLRVGNQLELPGMGTTSSVLTEIIDLFQLLNDGEESQLKDRIKDENYYQNFISLAREVAPDGERVKQIGLTSVNKDGEKKVKFVRTKRDITPSRSNTEEKQPSESDWETVKLHGELNMAHGRKNVIELFPSDGTKGKTKPYRITVPEGLNDLVRMYFGFDVIVDARQFEERIELIDITLLEESSI